mmetsp:Transcript_23597/g.66753  ORF Transcript_23597/g.66753 Transcript_23597/m.66753 type:complete len:263 (-) Transcript_23597:40-828(-)
MAVCIDDIPQLETQLVDGSQVSILVLQHRVNEHSFVCRPTTEHVGECRCLRIKQLLEDQVISMGLSTEHVLGWQLCHQPLPHRTTPYTIDVQLQADVGRELLGRHRTVSAALRQPQEESSSNSHARGALHHQRSGQRIQGVEHRRGLCLRGHRRRTREHLDVDHDPCALELRAVEVRAVGRVDIEPGLVAAGQASHIGRAQVPAESHVAGEHRHVDAQRLQGDVCEIGGDVLLRGRRRSAHADRLCERAVRFPHADATHRGT